MLHWKLRLPMLVVAAAAVAASAGNISILGLDLGGLFGSGGPFGFFW